MHQNLTFAVHPDPISGMHCWHQAVRIRPADPGDKHGDIAVDTARAHEVYRRWLTRTRPAGSVSPDGTRRPRWLMRPLKPPTGAFTLPAVPPGPPGDTNAAACSPIYSGEVALSARVPDLAALEALLAVAHAGSLTAASRELGITQQAVSARVRAAEAQTGWR